MPDINDELFDALARNQKEIKTFIDIETQLLVSSFSSISEYSQESLKIKATGAQEKITGKLLDFNFISHLKNPLNKTAADHYIPRRQGEKL